MSKRAITGEQVKEAILLLEWDGWTQEEIAQKYAVNQATVSKWEKSDWWQAAKEAILGELWATAELVGLKSLLQQARAGDTAAAKELLGRVKGTIEQRVKAQIEHSGKVEITDEESAALLRELAGISTDGASRQTSSNTEAESVHSSSSDG